MRKREVPPEFPIKIERTLVMASAILLAIVWVIGERAGTYADRVISADASALGIAGGWGFLGVTAGMIVLNAFFVASETAVDLLTALHVRHAGDKATARLQELLTNQQRYVAACSIGSQIARLALIFASLLLAQDFAPVLYGTTDEVMSFGRILVSALLIVVPLLILNLIVGELVPKSFASLHTTQVATRLFAFIRVSSFLFSIPAGLVVSLAGLLTARFGGKATFAMANQAEEQIKSLVETAQESGEIESDERELLHSVFEFTDTVVREIMTPRVDLEACPLGANPRDIAAMIESTGHSRIPIYEETDDQILGIIHAKDLLLAMVEGDVFDLRSLLRPPLFIPENMNLHEALTQMRVNRSQMAIVQDEFGGTAGIVTTEDIVEELVGDIVDEYDVEEPEMVRTESGFLVEGKTHLDDVNDEIGAGLESEEFDTIGGFVFGLFGRQPRVGESISCDGYTFTVAETDGRRIEKLAVERSTSEGYLED